jgi:hypothetical protein
MELYTAPPEEGWRLGPGPFIFSGVPPLCVGDVDLINESDDKVRVRRIPVVGHMEQKVSSLGLGEVRVATPLLPRRRTRARAFFRVDPFMPPGTYKADLSSGGQQEAVVVHVWEKRSLRIDPGEIRLHGTAGDVVTSLVVVTNQGNVPETLREIALVFLEERNWLGRSAVFAMRETTAEDGHQAYLDRFLHELKDSLARPARVNLRSEIAELQPGETREIELDITLPTELMKGRMYFGSTKFMSSRLIFKVECTGANSSTTGRPQ